MGDCYATHVLLVGFHRHQVAYFENRMLYYRPLVRSMTQGRRDTSFCIPEHWKENKQHDQLAYSACYFSQIWCNSALSFSLPQSSLAFRNRNMYECADSLREYCGCCTPFPVLSSGLAAKTVVTGLEQSGHSLLSRKSHFCSKPWFVLV